MTIWPNMTQNLSLLFIISKMSHICIQNDISGIFLSSKKSKCGIYRINRLLEIEKKTC